MRTAAIVISLIGLCLTLIPSLFVLYGAMSFRIHAQAMFAGMLIWFIFAPRWTKFQS